MEINGVKQTQEAGFVWDTWSDQVSDSKSPSSLGSGEAGHRCR
jgi:hypothetical protein